MSVYNVVDNLSIILITQLQSNYRVILKGIALLCYAFFILSNDYVKKNSNDDGMCGAFGRLCNN